MDRNHSRCLNILKGSVSLSTQASSIYEVSPHILNTENHINDG